MSTAVARPGGPQAPDDTSPLLTRGRWIEHWDPDDDAFWERSGRKIAKKNLIFSIFAENLGFSIWVLWTIVVLNLGNIGIVLSIGELFPVSYTHLTLPTTPYV